MASVCTKIMYAFREMNGKSEAPHNNMLEKSPLMIKVYTPNHNIAMVFGNVLYCLAGLHGLCKWCEMWRAVTVTRDT